MIGRGLSRRSVLATLAAGLTVGLSGCGYQPGGGEFDWERTVRGSIGPGGSSDGRWDTDGEYLYRIRNRSSETFTIDGWVELDDTHVTVLDSRGNTVWSGAVDGQHTGTPLVANGRVYLQLEDGQVAALERDGSEEGGPGTSAPDAETRWTTDWDGPELALAGGDGLLVGVHSDGIVAFDADSGDERFSHALEAEGTDDRPAAAVGDGRAWVAVGGDAPSLRCFDGDRSTRLEEPLPSTANWLEAVGSWAVLEVDGELWRVDPDGERRVILEIDGEADTPIVAGDRLYRYVGNALTAIDVADAERAWGHESASFRGTPVADEDGVYGHGTGRETSECGLVALTNGGEDWWEAATLEELGCSGTLHLVDDRLVVVNGDDLYAFHTAPGRRFSFF